MFDRAEKRALSIFGGIAIGAMLLAACGAEPGDSDSTVYRMVDVDGVQCVSYNQNGYVGGITCNWEAYNAGAK